MAGGIPYWPARAKDLRYQPDIYARYGGDDGDCEADAVSGKVGLGIAIPISS